MLWIRISIKTRCTTLCDKVCQWLATGQWFSPGPPVSSTNKTDRHDITEILLKVAFDTIKQTIAISTEIICILFKSIPFSLLQLAPIQNIWCFLLGHHLFIIYIFFTFCKIVVWREVTLRKKKQKTNNYIYFNEITVVSSIAWLFDERFDVLFIIWDIWKINKHFFYWWHILYDNKTTNLTLQKVPKKH
jgi:hypothetical protein